MKNLFLLIALTATLSAGAKEAGDTLVVNNAKKVMVINSDSLQRVVITGTDDNPNYKYESTLQLVDSNYVSTSRIDGRDFGFSIGGRSRGRHTSEVMAHVGLGFNMALGAPAEMDVRPFSSWEIWANILEYNHRYWRSSKDQIAVGIGIDWRSYRIKDDMRFAKSDHGITTLEPLPGGASPDFSRIKVFSVIMPVLYKYNGRYFTHFAIGPVINFNTYSSIKTRYKIDGHKVKDVSKDVHVNPITFDILAVVNIGGLDIYGKYSPCNLLDSGRGPKFQTLSFGFYF